MYFGFFSLFIVLDHMILLHLESTDMQLIKWPVSWPTAVPNTVDSCLHHLAVDSIIWITWPDAHCPKAIHCLYASLIYELKVPKGTL